MSSRSLDVWTLWALLATLVIALVIVVPFTPLPATITKTFVLAAGTIITLVLYIIARLSRGNIIFPPMALVGALWLPALAYVLSSLFSGLPFASALWGAALEQDTLGVMFLLAALGTLTALVARRVEHYETLLRVGAIVYAALAALQLAFLVLSQFIPGTLTPAFSLVGSYADLAFVLGLGVIGSLIAFRFVELSRTTRRLLVGATVAALLLIAVANSSFVWVALALVSLGLFIESAMMRKQAVDEGDLDDMAMLSEESFEQGGGSHSIALALPVLVVAIFFLVGSTLGGALADAFKVNIVSVNPSWESTFEVAQRAYATAPVFGTGPGSFGSEWLKYRDPAINTTYFWNIDFSSGNGVIPTSLVTTGIVGALAWLAFLILFLVLGFRTLIKRTPHDRTVRTVAIIAFVGAAYLFAAAIFRLPSTPVLALAFVLVGVFASTMRFAERAGQRGVVFAKSPRLGFVVVFSLTLLLFVGIVSAYALVVRYIATTALARANTEFATGNLAAAEISIERSLAFAPTAIAYQAQGELAIVRLSQIAASTTMPAAEAQKAFQATLSTGINAALTATRLAPASYRNWMTLGNLYAQAVPLSVSGAYESAKTAYDKAKELHPTSPEILLVLAQLNIAHKDFSAAKENLKAAIALKQDYTNAIFLLSQLEVQEGNVKGALASALSAAYFAPNNPNILFQVGVLRAAEADYPGAVEALVAAIAANSQYANARYFLAAVYAKQNNYTAAREQLEAIAALSSENATVVAPLIAALAAGKNPFPANLLTVSPAAVAPPATPAE